MISASYIHVFGSKQSKHRKHGQAVFFFDIISCSLNKRESAHNNQKGRHVEGNLLGSNTQMNFKQNTI